MRSTRTAIAGDTSTDVLASSRRGELVAAEAGDTVMDKVAEVLGVQLSATSAELQRVADSLETEVSTSLSSCAPSRSRLSLCVLRTPAMLTQP